MISDCFGTRQWDLSDTESIFVQGIFALIKMLIPIAIGVYTWKVCQIGDSHHRTSLLGLEDTISQLSFLPQKSVELTCFVKRNTLTMRPMLPAKLIIVIILVAFAVACGFYARDTVVFQGTAMLPSFKDGQLVKVKKFDRFEEPELKRGDVVVFLFPDDPSASYFKRLIGLPGDTVEISEGKVIVNGKEQAEPYIDSRLNQSHRSQQPTFVRPNYYYVLGDYRDNSSDSRIWGLVPERYIYAKVVSP